MGTLAPLLKRLYKAGLINRIRPENNERKLFLSLTDGVAFEDLTDDWKCPRCKQGKVKFNKA